MKSRTIVIAVAAVFAAGAGAWYAYGMLNSGGVQRTAGPYQTELANCQDRIHDDTMHVDDLKFVPDTTWHQVIDTDRMEIGGRFTRLNNFGRQQAFDYTCKFQQKRIVAVDMR